MNTNYWKVFFLDNDEHEPVASDRDSYTTPESMLPASGWWEFQPHEGLGWSQLLYVEMDLHLHLSENEWREYVEARQKCLAEQDFRQCDWLEPYGSIEQRWRDSEVRGFSRNLRNEITKKAKYYFLDLGVRNAVIGRFAPLSNRDDIGALWENFVFMELAKQSGFTDTADSYFFWRTHTGVEIDIIRESQGAIEAIECKWDKDARIPKTWRDAYPNSTFKTINRNNYLSQFA